MLSGLFALDTRVPYVCGHMREVANRGLLRLEQRGARVGALHCALGAPVMNPWPGDGTARRRPGLGQAPVGCRGQDLGVQAPRERT